MKLFAALSITLLMAGCSAIAPSPSSVRTIPGTAIGDPCTSERLLIDTPRGFPRLCEKGRWVPFCDSELAGSAYCKNAPGRHEGK
jgi:hypothetical protein